LADDGTQGPDRELLVMSGTGTVVVPRSSRLCMTI
jgi:hypothetical protein